MPAGVGVQRCVPVSANPQAGSVVPGMTELDLPSLQLQSSVMLSLSRRARRWLDRIYAFWRLWLWPWPNDLHLRTWPYPLKINRRPKMNFLGQGLSRLSRSSCRITDIHTYSETDRQTNRGDQKDYHAASWVMT